MMAAQTTFLLSAATMSGFRAVYALGLLSAALLYTLYYAGLETTDTLSAQGCGMSYMSPTYVAQDAFPGPRYSLVLYREAGWDAAAPDGLPVLFVPGNAGSAHQIRSVASAATRMFYAAPGKPGTEYKRALDFYALEHSGDLSALHGPTLDAEADHAARALEYIAQRYPPNTPVVLMGHSMGGVVAASLLAPGAVPSNITIAALVTLAAPHALPPARFDRRVDAFYARAHAGLATSPVPVLSICGGAADGMVPAESCVLPQADDGAGFRRTLFGSALEGAWTGFGHQAGVWCDHVRRPLARALLLLAPLAQYDERAAVLEHGLPDGASRTASAPGPGKTLNFQRSKKSKDFYPPSLQLALGDHAWNGIFMLPAPFARGSLFSMFVGGGAFRGVGPDVKHTKLTANAHACRQVSGDKPQGHSCVPLAPGRVRRIPYVHANTSFPRREGEAAFESHEPGKKGEAGVRSGAEGWRDEIAVWEMDAPMPEDDAPLWIGVEVEGSDGKGWLVAGGFEAAISRISYSYGVHDILRGPVLIRLDPAVMRTEIRLPRLAPSPLLVYRATPLWDNYTSCAAARIPPTLEHISPSSSEAHWHALLHADPHSPVYAPALLHTHAGAPFFAPPNMSADDAGMHLALYSSGPHAEGKCALRGLSLSLDLRASLGRAAARYYPALPAWALAVGLWVFPAAWAAGAPPSPRAALARFAMRQLPVLLAVASYIAALLPLGARYVLGNSGRAALAPLAPLMLLLAAGAVVLLYGVLSALLYPLSLASRALVRARPEGSAGVRRRAGGAAALLLLVGTLLPWQAALLGLWAWQLLSVARADARAHNARAAAGGGAEYVRLEPSDEDDEPGSAFVNDGPSPASLPGNGHGSGSEARRARAGARHVLLLLTLLLPFAAPALAVWARDAQAFGVIGARGGEGAFRGDHAVWLVAPWVALVAGGGVWAENARAPRSRVGETAKYAFRGAALAAAALGARRAYAVPEWAAAALALALAVRAAGRYWGARGAAVVIGAEKP